MAIPRAVKIAGAIGAAGAAGLAWSLWEARWYALRKVEVPVLPAGQEDFRVLHISDLHLLPTDEAKRRWVRRLVFYDPHLIINTGDNMAHASALSGVLDALAPFLVRPGAFVMGSNDYYGPRPKNPAKYLRHRSALDGMPRPEDIPGDELASVFENAGWLNLGNLRAEQIIDGRRVSFVGTEDAHISRDRFPAPESHGGEVGVEADVKIGVTHAPYSHVLQHMKDDGVDVAFAGHTHGGQLAIPGYGALVTNCDLDTGRVKGLHGWPGSRPDAPGGEDSIWLHVSAGLGTSPFTPVRFACRPEASLVTLTARK